MSWNFWLFKAICLGGVQKYNLYTQHWWCTKKRKYSLFPVSSYIVVLFDMTHFLCLSFCTSFELHAGSLYKWIEYALAVQTRPHTAQFGRYAGMGAQSRMHRLWICYPVCPLPQIHTFLQFDGHGSVVCLHPTKVFTVMPPPAHISWNATIRDVGTVLELISEGWGLNHCSVRSVSPVGGFLLRHGLISPAKADCPSILGYKSLWTAIETLVKILELWLSLRGERQTESGNTLPNKGNFCVEEGSGCVSMHSWHQLMSRILPDKGLLWLVSESIRNLVT